MSTAFQPQAPDPVALVTIHRVEQRIVTKRDHTQFTIYDVFIAEQSDPFNTTKKDIAESAHSLIGQVAEITYSVKVNGNFTNYWINSVLPGPATAADVAMRAQQAQPILQAAAPLALQTPAPLPAPIPQAPVDTTKTEQIHRQTAAKVAATIHAAAPGSASDFWENVEKLSHYFDTGEFPGQLSSLDVEDDGIPFDVRMS